jgi:hypothetical protein
MIARCDVCGGPLAATFRTEGRRQYQCHKAGHVRIDADPLDEIAEAALLTYLARPDIAAALVADEGDDEALAEARAALARVRAELEDLIDKVGRGAITAMLAAGAEPKIQARLAEATRQVEELATPSSLRGLIDPVGDVVVQWRAAPMPVRRDIARRLLGTDGLGELRVMRSPSRGHATPAADRVRWAP